MGALERAQEDVEAGRLWKARDRLEGYLRTDPHGQEVLAFLGEVCIRMGDLPAAGKYWYLTEGGTEEARRAFVDRCGGSPRQILSVLPIKPPLEEYPASVRARLDALAAEARGGTWDWWWTDKLGPRPKLGSRSGWGGRLGAYVAGAALLFLTVGIWILGVVYLLTRVL